MGMTLSTLTSAQLQRVIDLIKKKNALEARLESINQVLDALEGGASTSSRLKRRKSRKVSKASKDDLKNAMISSLRSAGKRGLSVKELARLSGWKMGSASVWIYTQGKKIAGFKKVAPGRFAILTK
jgi:hypothetical protein